MTYQICIMPILYDIDVAQTSPSYEFNKEISK